MLGMPFAVTFPPAAREPAHNYKFGDPCPRLCSTNADIIIADRKVKYPVYYVKERKALESKCYLQEMT